MFLRKKTISMDGAEVTISPLTGRQVEEHLAEEAEIVSEIRKAKESGQQPNGALKLRERLYRKLVATALNNAAPDLKISPERTLEEIDNVLLEKLQEEAMALSGLTFVSLKSPPGEG